MTAMSANVTVAIAAIRRVFISGYGSGRIRVFIAINVGVIVIAVA